MNQIESAEAGKKLAIDLNQDMTVMTEAAMLKALEAGVSDQDVLTGAMMATAIRLGHIYAMGHGLTENPEDQAKWKQYIEVCAKVARDTALSITALNAKGS